MTVGDYAAFGVGEHAFRLRTAAVKPEEVRGVSVERFSWASVPFRLLDSLGSGRLASRGRPGCGSMQISPIDFAIILVYLAGITLFGAHFRRGQQNLRDYFLGGRTAPWWAHRLLDRRHGNFHSDDHRHARHRVTQEILRFCNW